MPWPILHATCSALSDENVGVTNFFAWPVHLEFTRKKIDQLSETLAGVADLVYLDINGQIISLDARRKLRPPQSVQ